MRPPDDLLVIPSSDAFIFIGEPSTGVTVDSPPNQLQLAVSPMVIHLARTTDRTVIAWGSAEARLEWTTRTVRGRVIYEYLVQAGKNSMTRRDVKTLIDFGQFAGLYLRAGDSGDLYIHRTEQIHRSGLDPLVGFLAHAGRAGAIEITSFRATRSGWARGLYRWPVAWEVHGRFDGEPFALRAQSRAASTVFNWYIAGFGMQFVAGQLLRGNEAIPVYGLAEILALSMPLRKLAPKSE